MYVYDYKMYSGLRRDYQDLHYHTQIKSNSPLSAEKVNEKARSEMKGWPRSYHYKVELISTPETEQDKKPEYNKKELHNLLKLEGYLEAAMDLIVQKDILAGRNGYAYDQLVDLISDIKQEVAQLEQ